MNVYHYHYLLYDVKVAALLFPWAKIFNNADALCDALRVWDQRSVTLMG